VLKKILRGIKNSVNPDLTIQDYPFLKENLKEVYAYFKSNTPEDTYADDGHESLAYHVLNEERDSLNIKKATATLRELIIGKGNLPIDSLDIVRDTKFNNLKHINATLGIAIEDLPLYINHKRIDVRTVCRMRLEGYKVKVC
jgi:hypothetical protein